jgi:hypothetical protein
MAPAGTPGLIVARWCSSWSSRRRASPWRTRCSPGTPPTEELKLTLCVRAQDQGRARGVEVEAHEIPTVAMTSGSCESVTVALRCDGRATARQRRRTAVGLRPHAWAMARVLPCVAWRGVDSQGRVRTRSTWASVMRRGAPGRGSSRSPSVRCCAQRRHPRPTVGRVTPSCSAPAPWVGSVAQAKLIRARWARACAIVGRRVHRSKVARSSAGRRIGSTGRPLHLGVLLSPPHPKRMAFLLHDFCLRQ